MVKKMLLALLLALFLLPAAALADVQVIDDAGVIDADMEAEITRVIDEIERRHQVDLVVLVTYDVPYDPSEEGWRVRDYADDFFDNGGYGKGPDHSGMLYLIDLNNRMPWISTLGVMTGYLTDYRIDVIHEEAYPYLSWGDYGKAALAAINCTGKYLEQGREKGSFIYDEVTGERLSGLYNPLELFEVGIAAAAGLAVALVIVMSTGAAYSLSGSTYKYDMDQNASFSLVKDDEVYLRQSVSRMARSTGNTGGGGGSGGHSVSRGSGVHRSSSGRMHGGGGGRRF